MDVRDIKRWHWIMLGLLVGAALGGIRVYWGPDCRHSAARTLAQEWFEGALLRPELGLRLNDMVVHPPDADGNWWVTGRFSETRSYAGAAGDDGPRSQVLVKGSFKYKAIVPYKPRLWLKGMSRQQPSIREYLQAISAGLPPGQVMHRYAWYEQAGAVMGIWMGGAVVLVGGLWPILISLLSGAGFGFQRAESLAQYDLGRFAGGTEKLSAAAVAPQGTEMVADMAEHLAHELSESPEPNDMAADQPSSAPPPVRALTGEPVELPAPAEEEEKHYAGQFYPTAAHAEQSGESKA